ncbi:NAD-dependent epimerase/dehydratase family protein [Streptomyces antibioticus]|uniref:NAD-dependent epimerase/dehydratase family protein n=1 Tax=Streptomyces antibioticus TaxID=1890 RepID=UPI0034119668
MNILVTGSAGFIGSHLVTALNTRGHTVTGMDKRHGTTTTILGYLMAVIRETQPDVIVHLGASCSTSLSLEDPARDFTDNAIGTFNVAEAARLAGGVPVVYTSSVKVNPGADGKIAPLGLSKRVGEDYLRLYGDLYGLPSVILRPSTVYGPGQSGTAEAGWVTWFLRAFLNRKPITIHGDGTQSRDILHIDDFTTLLVDITEHHADYQRADPYDVGGGPENEVSLWRLLHWLTDSGLGRIGVSYDERLPGDLQHVVTDNTAITSVRGWTPAIHWQNGVQTTLEWMRRHP